MTNAPEIESLRCRCGLNMAMSRRAPECGMCINCDGLQPQEIQTNPLTGQKGARVQTPWDRSFDVAMKNLEREWFPDQKHEPIPETPKPKED